MWCFGCSAVWRLWTEKNSAGVCGCACNGVTGAQMVALVSTVFSTVVWRVCAWSSIGFVWEDNFSTDGAMTRRVLLFAPALNLGIYSACLPDNVWWGDGELMYADHITQLPTLRVGIKEYISTVSPTWRSCAWQFTESMKFKKNTLEAGSHLAKSASPVSCIYKTLNMHWEWTFDLY